MPHKLQSFRHANSKASADEAHSSADRTGTRTADEFRLVLKSHRTDRRAASNGTPALDKTLCGFTAQCKIAADLKKYFPG